MAIDINLLKKEEVLESVSSAVDREIEIGEFMVKKTNSEIKAFENKFKMGSDDFLKKFEGGKLGDNEEYFEWFSAIKAKERWQRKLHSLKSLSK